MKTNTLRQLRHNMHLVESNRISTARLKTISIVSGAFFAITSLIYAVNGNEGGMVLFATIGLGSILCGRIFTK